MPMQEEQELEQQDQQEQQEQQPPVETPPALTPPAPTSPEFDYRALYADSTRARIAAETELERFRQEQRQQTPETPSITDEDISQRPAESIRELIRRELQANLGPVNEISQEYKINKQMNEAENTVFNAYPDLAQYRQGLAAEVRSVLRNASSIDPSTYAVTLDAVIGRYARQNLMGQQVVPPTPPVPPAPAPRPNGAPPAPSSNAPNKLSEMERKAMRKVGLDPNKQADVKSFWDIVNNDEGITV